MAATLVRAAMTRIAGLAIARPRATLALWAVAIAALAVIGIGVENQLHRSDLTLPESPSGQANAAATQAFGPEESLIVVVTGPERELERQGPRLVRRLGRVDSARVASPWSSGADPGLRPSPGSAIVALRVARPFEEVSRQAVPTIRAVIADSVSPPVEADLSGYPAIAAGIHGGTVAGLRQGELIAAPLLLVILLLIFRSPVAALLPLLGGGATILAGSGLLEIVNGATDLDAVALNLLTMMGLALGVDYALLLVARFREELATGADVEAALTKTVATAGHTVVAAAAALLAAMAGAYLVAPGAILTSATVGVVLATVVSVATSVTALPAALSLLGPNLDRWYLGRRDRAGGGVGGLALRLLSRPLVAGGLVLALVAAMAAPALSLDTGPPDPRVLPEGDPGRAGFEQLREVGRGWSLPYEVTFLSADGPTTEQDTLRVLARWERALERSDLVEVALGPALLERRTRPVGRASEELERAGAELERARRGQRRLAHGLARADRGAGTLAQGIDGGAEGAERLASGAGEASAGADRLEGGIGRAVSGLGRLRAGTVRIGEGASRLAKGGARARRGTARLSKGLERGRRAVDRRLPRARRLERGLDDGARGLARLGEPARVIDTELKRALEALENALPTSQADPEVRRAFEAVARAQGASSGRNPLTGARIERGYSGIVAELERAATQAERAAAGAGRGADGLARLGNGLRRLDGGAGRLETGARRLERGASRLDSGGGRLEDAAARLERGGKRLGDGADGLGEGARRLSAGSRELADGLESGADAGTRLELGLGRMRTGVERSQERSEQLAGRLDASDGLSRLLDSGYARLAALDQAPDRSRESASLAVNVDRGGGAARLVVIGKGQLNARGHPLRAQLERDATRVADEVGADAVVGGPAARVQDFDAGTSGRLPLLAVVLALVTYLVLVPVLRSLWLPLVAVALNLLTVAAAFGVLVLLFQGDPLLGGPGWLDAIMALSIFAVVFGLSIDYEVFLLMRMREGWERTGTTAGAIEYGVSRTAAVVTGGALIMTGVFVAFALAEIVSLRQLGIGLTVAVLLDATLIRLVLLPAAIKLLGDRVWTLPRPAWLRA